MTFTTKQVAEAIGIEYMALVKAMFGGKVKRPANKLGRNWIWTRDEADRASWSINRCSINLPENELNAEQQETIRTLENLSDEAVYKAYMAGKV